MAYTIINAEAGVTQIANTDAGYTTANGTALAIPTPPMVLGKVVRAVDPTYGEGEFICLKGVASTVVGSLVWWDGTTYQSVLATVTSNVARPVAFAMAATTAALYGWYQISGTAVALKSTSQKFAATVALGIISTGKVGSVSSGKQLLGARTANAATVVSATTTVTVTINRPHAMGRVT